MQEATLILSDSKGEQWGTWPARFPVIPREGEIIHFISEQSGNAVFHVLFVQYNLIYKDNPGTADGPYLHVEICEDDEPWLTGTLRKFAEGLKSRGVKLYERDQRGW